MKIHMPLYKITQWDPPKFYSIYNSNNNPHTTLFRFTQFHLDPHMGVCVFSSIQCYHMISLCICHHKQNTELFYHHKNLWCCPFMIIGVSSLIYMPDMVLLSQTLVFFLFLTNRWLRHRIGHSSVWIFSISYLNYLQ